jgi:hypothetical protein
MGLDLERKAWGLREGKVQVSITKYHRLSTFKYLFLTVLEPGKSKIKVLADSMSGESLLSCLQLIVFSQCPQLVEGSGSSPSLLEGSKKTPLSMT